MTARTALYPNMYVVLMAPPAVGKSVGINAVYDFWNTSGILKLASQSVTKASMVDELAKASKSILLPDEKDHYRYSHLTICSSELGVLLPKHDLEFMNNLNHLYDCPESYSESRRTKDLEINIENPGLHILAGTQPGYLAEILPELAWRMGFTSRIIMVYSGVPIKPSLFDMAESDLNLKDALKQDLKKIGELRGVFAWTNEAMLFMSDWYKNHADASAPKHSRLQSYNPRRHMHVIKIAMAKCASDGDSMTLEVGHIKWAIDTLVECEAVMPQIFAEMSSSPDAAIIEDLTNFLLQDIVRTGNKNHLVPKHRIYQWLSSKVPTNRIGFLVESVTRAGILTEAGDKYKVRLDVDVS